MNGLFKFIYQIVDDFFFCCWLNKKNMYIYFFSFMNWTTKGYLYLSFRHLIDFKMKNYFKSKQLGIVILNVVFYSKL